jgi:hypothetical protein
MKEVSKSKIEEEYIKNYTHCGFIAGNVTYSTCA